MPRYIDAEALIFDSRICGNCKDRELCDGNIAFCPNASARRAINDAPTVEAEPVRHGHWIDKGVLEDYPKPGINVYHLLWCSECGAFHRVRHWCCGGWINASYCPNCGAKMDGGEENNG